MMRQLTVLLLFFIITDAYKILLVFPVPTNSHTNLGEGYVRHLLRAGHEVTYVTPVRIKNPSKHLRQIDVSSNFAFFPANDFLDLTRMVKKEIATHDITAVLRVMFGIAKETVLHENVQKLIHDPKEQFDVVIAEWMFSELYAGLAPIFNCPLIWSSSLEPHALVLALVDEAPNPAYVPDWASTVIPPLTFGQRVGELWTYLYVKYYKWLMSLKEVAVYEQAFTSAAVARGQQLPPYSAAVYNGSLMLGNSHASTGDAISLPQCYVPIAGYHIETVVQPLPAYLQNIMDNAKDGVIYFSLGSTISAKSLPNSMKRNFLDVFGSLKQTVIWKLEETLEELPKNVHVVSFAPQQSILAHPNCILFISHCGLLSTTETIYYGVPIIGIPVFADQFLNVDRAVQKGYAKRVDLGYDTPENLKAAIEEVLGDPRYRQRIKELSFSFHDRPVPPGKELVHWVEHVVGTRGAPHLRSPALMLPWYQKCYLDLLSLILLATIISIFIIWKLFKFKFSTKKIYAEKKCS